MKRILMGLPLAMALAVGSAWAEDKPGSKPADKPTGAAAKAGESATAPAKAKAEKSRGEAKDENIKQTREQVEKQEAAAAAKPAEKGGEKSRGGCGVHFDNSSGYFIDVYVDGSFRGTVGPYGDAVEYYNGTRGTIYGKSAAGLSWGPLVAQCINGQFYFQFQ